LFRQGRKTGNGGALKELLPMPWLWGNAFSEVKMPYALFCEDAKISRAYPTEADVWKHAAENGLVVDVASEGNHPKRILDNGYTIRPCQRDLD
jgi:hypothetical protein